MGVEGRDGGVEVEGDVGGIFWVLFFWFGVVGVFRFLFFMFVLGIEV